MLDDNEFATRMSDARSLVESADPLFGEPESQPTAQALKPAPPWLRDAAAQACWQYASIYLSAGEFEREAVREATRGLAFIQLCTSITQLIVPSRDERLFDIALAAAALDGSGDDRFMRVTVGRLRG